MISWFAVHTQPLKEFVARENLQAQGLQVYLPQYKKIRRHARKTDTVLAPLFPRYLFVAMDPDSVQWRCINNTRGVSYLLTSSDHKPIRVPHHLVESLQTHEDEAGAVPLTNLVSFIKGQSVRILEGPFKDLLATFDVMDDKQRVTLLLTFMGRETSVVVPSHSVEKVP